MERTMHRKLFTSLAASTAVMLLPMARQPVLADGAAAVTGQVSSEAEGNMEGVVVTARKAGAKFSVSVVTDAQGRYSFPADRLEPGQYSLTIRAIGYELSNKVAADAAVGKTATADLKLVKTKRLASQLSNAEWM